MHSLIEKTHPEWQATLKTALSCMDANYLNSLWERKDWLPGPDRIFATFCQPMSKLNYILLGESPYPRKESANGYAFWDNSVQSLWSAKGLSKEVNRATSLRNFIKMLLVAGGNLGSDTSQEAIVKIDKSLYWQTAEQFFLSLVHRGFLLLNASLVFCNDEVRFHAKQWQPFMISILMQLSTRQLPVQLLLFGKIAKQIPQTSLFPCLISEHPYNLSFITNPDVLEFFKPLNLLSSYE